MTLHDILAVEMSVAQVASETSFLLVCTLNVFFEVVVEGGFVTADMAHFEIAFFGMAVAHVFLKTFLQGVGIITLITFPGLLGLVLVHDVLLDMLVILATMGTKTSFLLADPWQLI